MGPTHLCPRIRVGIAVAVSTLVACGSNPVAAPSPPRSTQASPVAGTDSTSPADVGQPIDVSSLPGRIVFSNSTEDIYIVNADGSGLTRLTTHPANDFDPALSPDGTLVAFRSERDGNNEVYVMNADGSGQHDVSSDPAEDWGPTWSPDGAVLWNCAQDLSIGFRACVSNADSTGLHVIPVGVYFEYPAWSPDGSKIAFMSQEPGAFGNDPNYDIFVVNADGSGLQQVTNDPGQDGFPSWSPDGSQLAFSSTRDDCSNSTAPDCKSSGDIGPYHTLYLMNPDGSDQHRISDRFAQFVDWSPDGSYLVFSPGLNVIRPDGTGLTPIPVAGLGLDLEFADWGV